MTMPRRVHRLDADSFGISYVYRALRPSQCEAIVSARGAGVRARDLAREYGVSVRMIYRVCERSRCPSLRVEVGGWWAEFALTAEGPVRMTAWYAA